MNGNNFREILNRHKLYLWKRRQEAKNQSEQKYWSRMIQDLIEDEKAIAKARKHITIEGW